jgi:hypothetical protein
LDPQSSLAFHLRGLAYYAAGEHYLSISEYENYYLIEIRFPFNSYFIFDVSTFCICLFIIIAPPFLTRSFKKAVACKSSNFDCGVMAAVACQALGMFKESQALFAQTMGAQEMQSDYKHSCWYQVVNEG